MYVWPCIVYENDERYQLDATIMIYYHKYLYMFQASICPSSGVQVACCCRWWSALGVVAVVLRSRCVVLCTVCEFVSDFQSVSLFLYMLYVWPCIIYENDERYQLDETTHTQFTRLNTGSLGPQPQHLVLNNTCSNTQPALLKMDI